MKKLFSLLVGLVLLSGCVTETHTGPMVVERVYTGPPPSPVFVEYVSPPVVYVSPPIIVHRHPVIIHRPPVVHPGPIHKR